MDDRTERHDRSGGDDRSDANGDGTDPRVHSMLRQLALVDEVIGLRAELAELRHRMEVAGTPTGTPPIDDPAQDLHGAEARAEGAEAALAAVLRSRSWRIGQTVVGVAGRVARIARGRRIGLRTPPHPD